ncbi:MAG: hypothetical protein B7X53_01140 [Hyphomonas sp. 34-62-18]|nr:MAG: hypothetical protein B7X53_01140 [Hyphomonas sp. 34-62-18]
MNNSRNSLALLQLIVEHFENGRVLRIVRCDDLGRNVSRMSQSFIRNRHAHEISVGWQLK